MNQSNPFYKLVEREIPFKPAQKGAYDKWNARYLGNEAKRPVQADMILKFCQTPKSSLEIGEMLGNKSDTQIRMKFLQYLLDDGELKLTISDNPFSRYQRFITAGYESAIIPSEAVLEFCKTPRLKTEISAHFNQSNYQMSFIVNLLIKEGKLVACDGSIRNNACKRFVAADSGVSVDRVEQLIQFCCVPRKRYQIRMHLNISITTAYELVRAQVKAGKLKLLVPEKPNRKDQRIVATEVEGG